MSDDSNGRRQRAQDRASYVGRIGGMELLGGTQVVASTPSQRVAQVRAATMIGWELSGKPMPSYRRCDAPGRVVRAATRTDIPRRLNDVVECAIEHGQRPLP